MHKIMLLVVFLTFCAVTHAQYAGWMLGTWTGTKGTLQINDVSGGNFTGTKTTTINNTNITIEISGAFRGRGMYLQDGEVLNTTGAESPQAYDCSACSPTTKIVIRNDSLVLINSILDCDEKCDGETFYARLLSEYDSATQRYLVDRFGRPSDIIGFRPFQPQKDETAASDNEKVPLLNKVSAAPVASNKNIVQHLNDSIRMVQQKQRQQQRLADSVNLVKQREQWLKDSLDNVAKLEQIKLRTADSLRAVQAKQQQAITDSLNLVKAQAQQRIQDSLAHIARIQRQHTTDSMLLEQQKKRQQAIADSLNMVQQAQQRIKDSLDKVAELERIRFRTEDSLRTVQAKKRQQEVTDSLNLANQREQQRLKDSLQSIAAARLQQQRIADSLLHIQVIKKQQAADSLAALRKQRYNDSLQQAAMLKKAPPAADTVLTSRTSVLLGTYHITSPDILIELFDNAEIDGDRVSVYHNDTLIVSNQMLDKKPITLNIHADTTNRTHAFVMVAENLGTIPPNSALMRITAGKQSYKLSVKTDMKTNARIVFYYDGD